MKKITLFILLIFFLGGTLNVYSRPGRGRWVKHPKHNRGDWSLYGANWDNILDRLNLSDKQLEKIEKIRLNTRKKMIKLGAQVSELNIEMKEEFLKEKIDENKIKDLINKINKSRSEIFKLQVMSRIEILKVLTPEQRKEIRLSFLK